MGGFDKRLHAPARLKLCAALMPLEEAEFQWLRERLEVSDSVLSKHLSHLEQAGFVALVKHAVGGRRRTSVRMTTLGRSAFAAHLAALQDLIGSVEAGRPPAQGGSNT